MPLLFPLMIFAQMPIVHPSLIHALCPVAGITKDVFDGPIAAAPTADTAAWPAKAVRS